MRAIHNTAGSIFSFYFTKIMLCLLSSALCIVAISEHDVGMPFWYYYFLPVPVLFLIADVITLPIEISNRGVCFHHLWRRSFLDFTGTKTFDIGSGWSFKWQRKEYEALLIAKGDRLLSWKIFFCDSKNQLLSVYTDRDG